MARKPNLKDLLSVEWDGESATCTGCKSKCDFGQGTQVDHEERRYRFCWPCWQTYNVLISTSEVPVASEPAIKEPTVPPPAPSEAPRREPSPPPIQGELFA